MKARIPKHREFVIDLENTAEEKREECWEKLEAILEDYKKEGKSVYTPTFIEDNEDKVKALQQEYGFAYTIELKEKKPPHQGAFLYPPRREGTLPSLNREIKSPAAPPRANPGRLCPPKGRILKMDTIYLKNPPRKV